jgi:cytochrome c oxidase subunit 3
MVLTLLFAGVFLAIKYVEYSHKLPTVWAPPSPSEEIPASARRGSRPDPGARRFFSIYFVMTGCTASCCGHGPVHLAHPPRPPRGPSPVYGPVDSVALYWHLIDLI